MSAFSKAKQSFDTDGQVPAKKWGWHQIDPIRYGLLVVAVLGQLATVLITWELWQVRELPPHLPLVPWTQIPFGLVMIMSLVAVLLAPKGGFWLHVATITVASFWDQFRLQPQFLAMIFLMAAAITPRGQRICRWFLAALWLWAGLHKMLSPHWFAHASYWILRAFDLSPEQIEPLHMGFALSVGIGEMAVGILAIFKVRWAAFGCVAMHISIFAMLVLIEWNYSVLPWNLATAIVGAWALWNLPVKVATDNQRFVHIDGVEFLTATVLFVAPVGFFWGLVDHGYANVLYSDFVPRALITREFELTEINGWDPVHVPFPYERRTHAAYFKAVAQPGDKLHIFDPRPALSDLYFVKLPSGAISQIGEDEFFSQKNGHRAGIGMDDRCARFWLRHWGTITQRWYAGESKNPSNLISYAYTLKPEHYRPEVFSFLQGLPNLVQLQLADCAVTDRDLQKIAALKNLQGIGLNNTSITDRGLEYLAPLKQLEILEIDNTQASPAGLQKLKRAMGLTPTPR